MVEEETDLCAKSTVFIVGTSMGCAIIWSFVELFGESEVKNYTFVDQAPLQNMRDDWCLGSTGCFDEASLKNLQRAVLKGPDLSEFADGNERACLAEGSSFKCEKEVKECTMGCKPEALAELMADHTNLDWRPLVGSLEKRRSWLLERVRKFSLERRGVRGIFDEQRANYGL